MTDTLESPGIHSLHFGTTYTAGDQPHLQSPCCDAIRQSKAHRGTKHGTRVVGESVCGHEGTCDLTQVRRP